MADKKFILPLSIIGSADVRRLLRELKTIDDYLNQAAIRGSGMKVALPKVSKSLQDLADDNKHNLLYVDDRKVLRTQLETLEEKAPVIHMSFASEPSGTFINKMITWLRREIHPEVLLQVGLQPTIAAGCIVRTPSKYYDFSLRKQFDEQRPLLLQQLKETA
jgi:F0F1-type ATP synthase delta subunit